MSISRKQFIKNAALIGAGSTFFKQNLFAKKPIDTFSCTLTKQMDLRSNYPGISDDDILMIEGNGIVYGKSTPTYPFYKDENFSADCKPVGSSTCDNSDDLIGSPPIESYKSNLKYYVYYPNISYTDCALPAFIVAHPGGFSDCSSLNANPNDAIRVLCIEMAKRGYICFSVEYRRGRIKKGGFVTVQQMLGYYRGCQDFRGAIRSIINRQRLFPTIDPFKFDENLVFVGGMSAGSFAALNAAYINQAIIEDVLGTSITTTMGGLDVDLYTGGASISSPPTIKGVMDCWGNFYIGPGGIFNIPAYFSTKGVTYFPPAICFQGMQDLVAFPHTQGATFPPISQTSYNTDNCVTNGTSYTLPPPLLPVGNPNLYACGAEIVFNVLLANSIPCEIYEDPTMAHGWNDTDDNFGTAVTTAQDLAIYIAQRTATYFQAIRLGGASLLGQNFFSDCENYRHAAQVRSDACPITNPTKKTSPF